MKNIVSKTAVKFLHNNSVGYAVKRVNQNNVPRGILVKDVKSEIVRIGEIRELRLKNKINSSTKRIEDRVRYIFEKKMAGFAEHLPTDGYSMGGQRSIFVMGVLVSGFSDADYYSKSCKYKPTHGYVKLSLSVSEARNCRIIGGMITVVGDLVGNGLRKSKWIESKGSKNNHEIFWVDGFLAGDYHFKAGTIKEARIKAKEYYRIKKDKERSEKKMAKALKRRNNRTFVGYEDSINAGNCQSGTNNFAKAIRIDLEKIGAVRADFLLEMAKKHNVLSFAEKAVKQAKIRYSN